MFFVRPDGSARYTAEEAEREEGGTPNVIGCVRVGLVMQLQYAVGYGTIDALESAMAEEARRRCARLCVCMCARVRVRLFVY